MSPPERYSLLGGGVFGDSLGALGDGVLGKLTRKEKPHGSLDFPRGDGGSLVVESQAGSLTSDTLKDVIHERVHDRHGLAGHTSVGVNLLEHLVDVDGVRLTPLLPSLLVALGDGLLGLSGLLGSFSRGFGSHCDE